MRVFIPDPTYGDGEWAEGAQDGPLSGPSAEFRSKLAQEFGQEFSFASIGTGAAEASYFTEILSNPVVQAALSMFFAGNVIKGSIEGWEWVYSKLSKFFPYEPRLDREAAAILVYKAVQEKMGGIPNSYRLNGFLIQYRRRQPDPWNFPDPGPITSIDPAPERVERQMVYVFQVTADGSNFRISVDGTKVTFLEG